MHQRFYAPDLERGAATVRLPSDEARHLLRVLRLRQGDPVRVFNGRGLECAGRVEVIDRENVSVAIEGEAKASREPRCRITLVQALLKGDAMDGVVRDAVMLGVNAIAPVLSAHVEGDRRGHAAGLRVSRWARIAVASAKQCGRAVVPTVAAPVSLSACLSATPADLRVVFAEPAAAVPSVSLDALRPIGTSDAVSVFVGPEGGWAADELRLLSGYHAVAVTLGERTLRAEAAALIGLSALHAIWGEFS